MFDIRPYQFLEWNSESFCCGDYVALVLKDFLNAELPAINYSGGVIEAAIALKSTPARSLFKKIDKPKPFCVVEMQQYRSADHVGVCVEVDGVLKITHCENGAGVLLSSFAEISEHYKILAFYEYC